MDVDREEPRETSGCMAPSRCFGALHLFFLTAMHAVMYGDTSGCFGLTYKGMRRVHTGDHARQCITLWCVYHAVTAKSMCGCTTYDSTLRAHAYHMYLYTYTTHRKTSF